MNHNENNNVMNSMKGNHNMNNHNENNSMKTSQIIIFLAGLSSLFITGCQSDNANLKTSVNDHQISVKTYTTCYAFDLGCVTKIWRESAKEVSVETPEVASTEKIADKVMAAAPAAAPLGTETYKSSVKARAISRAGKCNNLNGHVLEIMGGDKTNLNPTNGLRETMTKSPNAKSVDAIVTDGKKIVQRIQYKDTPQSISKTIQQVKSGQYNSVTLKGTSETAEAFNKLAQKIGLCKQMQDTGISSDTTKTIAKSCGSAKDYSMLKAVKHSAKGGAVAGAVVSAGISAVTNAIEYSNGDKTLKQAATEVAVDTAGGTIAGAAAASAATFAGSAVATGLAVAGVTGLAATTATVTIPIAVAVGTAYGVSYVWEKTVAVKVKAKTDNPAEETVTGER